MTVSLQILLAAASVLALLGVMTIIRHLAKSAGLAAEMQRKLMHVNTGLFALLLPWLFPDRWPVYMLIAATMLVMLVLRLPRFSSGLGAALHGVERTSYGEFLLALSVGLCFLLARENTLFYILPIAVLTLADAAAALAGTTYGTKRYVVEDGDKSLEGSVVFFVVTLLVAIICFLFLSKLPPSNIMMLSLMVAAFGTLVEAQSWRGFDNLFLPLGLLIFLKSHYHSSLAELALLAAMFFAALASFGVVGTKLGLTKHTTRVYVVAVFLLLAAAKLQNTLLPILVLAAHGWARTVSPCDSKYSDLDIVAALGLLGFGWLAAGNATGWDAISFFGLSAMGLAMGLIAVALRAIPVAVPLAATVLFVIRTWVVPQNSEQSNWAEPLTVLALISLLCTAAVPLIRPQWFDKDRVLKLTLLALIPPLTYYAWTVAASMGDGFFAGVVS
ncbi:hypothetical protein SAMN05444358_103280 [Ruegeria halocynthiae]|uniref:Phytol kinase n=1 Tax=Ruegeria halocynthiae TaxID=985054 RepID=A0A1H2ZLF2_9RHOB|nr:hypothetical protein [Ruegeria halocynthiae]SDX18195.1 hypothetical protein SAMN05444358_103280 [Ruegeria halocynthiae]